MGSINKGDRVRVTTLLGTHGGQEGTIDEVAVSVANGVTAVLVNFGEDGCWFVPEDVEVFDPSPAEPVVGGEISFNQIRKGDTIRTVREFEDGFVLTMEGVADHLRFDGSWVAKDGSHSVAPEGKGAALKQHHILVDRPEPKDHLVVFSRTTGGVEAYTVVGRTKTEAEKMAAACNDREAGKIERRVFRAVKVS